MYQHDTTTVKTSWLTFEEVEGKTLNELAELTKQLDVDMYNHFDLYTISYFISCDSRY